MLICFYDSILILGGKKVDDVETEYVAERLENRVGFMGFEGGAYMFPSLILDFLLFCLRCVECMGRTKRE